MFYRPRIPQYSCARKETVDIDILVTSRNGDRKIIKTMCRVFPPLKSTSYFLAQSTVSLVGQIQVLKLILVVATDQMLDHI